MARVLSIQSHVVHGYCGNKCATAVFLLNGIDADFIQAVHFSTPTNYSNVKGTKMTGEEFNDIIDGLRSNNLLNYSYVYNGYIGDAGLLLNISSLVENLRKTSVLPFFVCDPVLGDDNRFYVHESLAKLYKEKVLVNADIILPNIFELEILSGIPIQSRDDVLIALRKMHADFNIPIVVLTSIKTFRHKKKGKEGVRVDESFFNTEIGKRFAFSSSSSSVSPLSAVFIPDTPTHSAADVKPAVTDGDDENFFDLVLYASVQNPSSVKTSSSSSSSSTTQNFPAPAAAEGKAYSLVSLVFPYLEGVFSGVGDTFASLFVSHVIKELAKEEKIRCGSSSVCESSGSRRGCGSVGGDGGAVHVPKLPSVEMVKVACERSVTALNKLLIKTKQERSGEIVINHCVHELMSDAVNFTAEMS